MSNRGTTFVRLRELWLLRRSRCPSCGYDLTGLTIENGALCPECGRAGTQAWASRSRLGADGRDSLALIVLRAMFIGVVVVLPWMMWLGFLIWRISLQIRPSDFMITTAAGALTVYSITLVTWSAHASTLGSGRLFNLIVRALISIGASAFAGWLTHVTIWWSWKFLQ